jgi:beta-phosphoglucomutase
MPLNVQKVKWGHMLRPTSDTRPPPEPRPSGTAAGTSPNMEHRDPSADDIFAAWVLGPAAHVPRLSTRAGLQAVLFDLDGVLVDTAEFHYRAWQKLADDLGVPFNRQMNEHFRGVGRMECLEKLLGTHTRSFVAEEKRVLAERKNEHYLQLVRQLSPRDLLPGARGLAMGLRGLSDGGARLAVVSASRNARLVLQLLAIADWFDTVIDGSDVTRGKPDPQGFLLAAERLRVQPSQCVVIEDAEAGIRAARAAGMHSIGIGPAATGANTTADAIGGITVETLETLIPQI